MSDELKKKVVDLESSLGLLQHDFEKQNEMIFQNSRQLQAMEFTIKRLMDQMSGLQNSIASSGTIEDEKPPHY